MNIEFTFDTTNFDITKNGCWEWKKSKASALKYGVISFYKRMYYVHRLSYRLFKGEIPNDKVIMHICDNPPCFNPNHLQLGTPKENSNDMWMKNRARDMTGRFTGDKNPNCKFSNEDCAKMISLYKSGISIKLIRQDFKISAAQFYRIRKGIRT